MPSQKGSLKDRIRSWNLFLKYKFKILKKNREEKIRNKKLKKELNKNLQISASGKYYSKPKIFGLTLAGLFLGIFESKIDKEKQIDNLEKEIASLENNINTVIYNNHNYNVIIIRKNISLLKSKNMFDESAIERIKHCENKLETIVEKKMIQKEGINNSKENVYVNKIKGVYTPILEVKVINKEIKNNAKKLKELNEKIKKTTDYNSLYEIEYSIKQIKIRFTELLNQYKNIKELPGFSNLINILDIEDIDYNDLRFNSNKIVEQIKKCNEYLDDINVKRVEMLSSKEELKKDVEREKKQKEKEKDRKNELKKEENKLIEVELANKIILDRIAVEQKNIAKFQKIIVKMTKKKKRKSIFFYTKNILSSIVNFGLGLFPISLFRNKLIGGLTSGIMINNSLKSIRKVLTPEVETVYILYNDFEKELNKTSDYLDSINYVCGDSLKQISMIRNTIYEQYGSDLEYSNLLTEYLKELDSVEAKILREQTIILNMKEQVATTKKANKQKVKELNL